MNRKNGSIYNKEFNKFTLKMLNNMGEKFKNRMKISCLFFKLNAENL